MKITTKSDQASEPWNPYDLIVHEKSRTQISLNTVKIQHGHVIPYGWMITMLQKKKDHNDKFY